MLHVINYLVKLFSERIWSAAAAGTVTASSCKMDGKNTVFFPANKLGCALFAKISTKKRILFAITAFCQ